MHSTYGYDQKMLFGARNAEATWNEEVWTGVVYDEKTTQGNGSAWWALQIARDGGDGHIDIPVYGLPRKSHKKIQVVIRSGMIKNVRVKKTFVPKLIEKIDNSFFYDHFDNNEKYLQEFADAMSEKNRKNDSIDLANDTENTSQTT